MGACGSVHTTAVETDTKPIKSIQIQPVPGATTKNHIGSDVHPSIGIPSQTQEVSSASSLPLHPQPSISSSQPHPFGQELTSPELHALFPSFTPPRKLSAEELELWSNQILLQPIQFIEREPAQWNHILINQTIPDQYRVQLWSTVLKIDSIQTPHTYSEYLQQPSPADDQIGRDIYRTFSDHAFFTHKPVQRCIGRILHAWSLYNPVVSYVQGHNYLAALFLMVTLDEELAWRCFLSFLAHPHHGMQQYYEDGLKLLINQCTYLDAILHTAMPKLANHFQNKNLDPLMWATPFYLTAFTHHLTLESCIYIFDFILMANLTQRPLPVPSSNTTASSVAPAPQLSESSISIRITHLTLALLKEQESTFLSIQPMDKLFKTIQQLEVLRSQKSRKKIFERAILAK